jgi:type IV pilus assembly protein PilC
MPNYFYTARGLKGDFKSGDIEAENESALALTLKEQGYFLIGTDSINIPKNKFGLGGPSLFFKSVSLKDRLMLTRNLKFMFGAGLSLPKAFRVLAKQTKNKEMYASLIDISDQVTKGKKLSEAMSTHPKVFTEFYCNMVKVGEESGALDEVLSNLKNQLEKELELKSKVTAALIYPIILSSVVLVLGLVMIIFVVPQFSNVFLIMGIEVPVVTRFILNLGGFLSSYWYLILFLMIATFFSQKFILKTAWGKSFWDKWSLKIPVVGKVVQKSALASIARVLSALISSNVPVAKSLEIVSRTVKNNSFKKTLAKASDDVKKGLNLSESLNNAEKIYPDFFIQILQVGEETGQTSVILGELADFFEKEVIDATQNLSSIIEPVLILLIGGCVALMAGSILSPLYSSLNSF